MSAVDIAVFIAFIVGVVGLGLWKSKSEKKPVESGETQDAAKDYFLAGGSLPWWVIGFSLIAANISTEQFVGMSGQAADWLGMAIASYEWIAAITLVVVAFVFLPKFLKSGIYTIPEFLEYRYDPISRFCMAVFSMFILVLVPTASVIYSGATIMDIFFKGQFLFGIEAIPLDITVSCWIIGLLAVTYVFAGGLKACAWADLIQGSALIIGGAIVTYLGISALGSADVSTLVASPDVAPMFANIPNYPVFGYESLLPDSVANMSGLERMWELNQAKFHMVLPATDSSIPWTALIFFGLWIPNFFYWGLNQYITQRTLGAKSLNEGQKGIVFAAGMKLIIPFIIVIIGIMAFNLYSHDLDREGRWQSAITLCKEPQLLNTLDEKFQLDYISANDPDTAAIYNNYCKVRDEGLIAKSKDSSIVTLFKFDKHFATLHPKDAIKIYAFNMAHVNAQTIDTAFTFPQPSEFEVGLIVSQKSGLRNDMAKFGADFSAINDKLVSKPIPNKQSVSSLSGYRFDMTYGTVLKNLVKNDDSVAGTGIAGFVLAAIFGAVVSSLASMLNSASTIFTMDIFYKFVPSAKHTTLVWVGRTMTVIFVLIACILAPFLANPAFSGIFTYIQEFQGFISPGVLAIFIFGLLIAKAPRCCGLVGLILCPIIFGLLMKGDSLLNKIGMHTGAIYDMFHWVAQRSFLDRMSITFVIILVTLTTITLLRPLSQPVELPVNEKMDMTTTKATKLAGWVVVIATLVLYAVFA